MLQTMTTAKCPPDCTCYGCLEKMADPKCKDCCGDGYWVEGDNDVLCPCTEADRLRGAEKAEKRAADKSQEGKATK